jgi:hypothetical protein
MAQEIAIRGSNYAGKERSPVNVILLSLVTFGIYGIFHYYYINKELAELGKARGVKELGENPGMSVLAITLGCVLLFIPPFVSVWNTWKRQSAARQMFGVQEGMDNVPGFLLQLFVSPVGIYFLQSGQNATLAAQARA